MKKLILFIIILSTINNYTKAQSLVSCNPNQGYPNQTLTVTITGQGTFFQPASPTINGIYLKQPNLPQINSTSFNVTSDTTVDANFTIPISIPLGYYDVHVNQYANLGNLTLVGGFLILLNGINENEIDKAVTIYPNPASNDIQVVLKDVSCNNADIKIYDVNGKAVFVQNYNNFKNKPLAIDLSNQASGIYLLQIKTKEKNLTKKFTIAR